jgi:SAM-dependent methyltransferase
MKELYMTLDEEGYFVLDGQRILDSARGSELLEHLEAKPLRSVKTLINKNIYRVEVYDVPLILNDFRIGKNSWTGSANYSYEFEFSLDQLYLDDWDRLLGYDSKGRAFVFAKNAYSKFIDSVESFDDEEFSFANLKYPLAPWLSTSVSTESPNFWDSKYLESESPGWELGHAAAPLTQSWAQLKVPKSRILVLGCGSGNDAAYLAELGHIVTAVDYSSQAIEQAKKKYGHIPNLKFLQLDVFNLPESFSNSFDIIFEHTLFCAIPFDKRRELVKIWKRCLTDQGLLFAILFVMDHKTHPPFGGSEWEYRERLKKDFRFLYWTRWKESEDWRKGIELVVYAQVKKF